MAGGTRPLLRSGGTVVVTMLNPVAGVVIHKWVQVCDRLFGTHLDVDHIRGMSTDEAYFLLDNEIRAVLSAAGFSDFRKFPFITQWGFNHLLLGHKR